MVVIYLFKSNIFSVESSPGGHGRDGKGRGKDIWFWLGFICRALLPVHVHYHGNFKGDEMFHYLQDFCFTLGTYSSERCGEKITIALLAMISTNWNQRVSHHCFEAMRSCRSSGSTFICPVLFVTLKKSSWISCLLRGRQ